MPNVKRKICRYERPCEPLNLKQWLSCRLHHHDRLRPEEIAAASEIPYHRLKVFANEGQTHDHIGAEALVRFCRATGSPDGLDFLLAPLGFVMVARDIASTDHQIIAEALDVNAGAGRVSALVRQSIRGGIDNDERAEIRDECRRLTKEIAELEAAAQPVELRRPRAV